MDVQLTNQQQPCDVIMSLMAEEFFQHLFEFMLQKKLKGAQPNTCVPNKMASKCIFSI